MQKLYFPDYLLPITFNNDHKLLTNMDEWESEVKQAFEKHPDDHSLIAYTLAINLAQHDNAAERKDACNKNSGGKLDMDADGFTSNKS